MSSSSPVQYDRKGDVVVITLDDGKMNSFGFVMCDALNAALDRALQEEGQVSILIVGNKKVKKTQLRNISMTMRTYIF